MKYYIISGEASGDLHASNLIKELKQLDPEAKFRAWGGDLMKEQGADLVKHYHELAFMGFVEVLQNLRTILGNIEFCKRDLLNYAPDALVLVDYPGFNMRIAEFAKKQGIRVFYYISPQVWAWKQSRVKKIRKYVDHMFVILPFEEEFYSKFNYKVDFVGHPLLDAIKDQNINKPDFHEFWRINSLEDKPIIALLPGSRKQEINKMLPVMLSVKDQFSDYQLVIAGAPSIEPAYYRQFEGSNVKMVYNKTYDLLQQSSAALVTSGTATLETALFKVPEIVCYSAGNLSYQLAKRLIKVQYISLVNLIMKREVVKELIQSEFNKENLTRELSKLLTDGKERERIKEDFNTLQSKLGGAGASYKTAKLLISYISAGVAN